MTLAIFWIFGLLAGSLTSRNADTMLAPTMLSAVSGSLSIFGLLTVILLPLLLTATAVFISRPGFLYPVVFLKAFLMAFTGVGLLLTLGSSGWLLRFLLMFSDMLILPPLWFLWLQIVSGRDRLALYCLLIVIFLVILAGFLDYSLVAPFLADLVTF